MTLAWNQSLFLWLNHLCSPLPDWFWSSMTINGHTSMIFALFAPLLFRHSKIVTALFASSLVGGVVSTTIKEALQIPRPPAVLALDHFHLIGDKLELVSFPSGHSLAAFAAVTLLILGLQLRGWRLLVALWIASLVGLSRVAVGAHWPLDVLGGCVLGTFCALAGWAISSRIYSKWQWPRSGVYLSCQAGIILIVSASLFHTDMGYPLATAWQAIIGAFGVICAVFCIYKHSKSVKIQKTDS